MQPARARRPRVRIVVSALLAAAAVACLVPSLASQTPGTGTVRAWLTTADGENLLAEGAPIAFGADSGANPLTIEVDPASSYQVFDGVGAALTDSSAWLLYNRLSTSPVDRRRELLERLFDRTGGIGLNYLRVPIGGTDFALSHYTYDDLPPGQTDPGLTRFSIDHDRAYILPLLREILAVNPGLRIVAAPWSPPAWMKTTGSLIGGWLKTDAESVYADYLVKFVQAYEDAGVPVHRLTVQNEPRATAPDDYPAMRMDPPQQARIIADYLGPGIAAAGLETRIDVWDHNWDNTSYATSLFTHPGASPYTAGSAWHCYGGEPTAMSTIRNAFPSKDVLVTECSGGEWQRSFGEAFAEDMEALVIAAPRNWARAVIKWNLALDTNNGPHTGGCTGCTGLVTIDQATRSVAAFNYDYYSLGHLGKFVVPGARRIASTSFGASSIQDVAFTNPDGSRVLVVFNGDASAARTFKVREAGRSFSYTLPPLGAVTFTWRDTGGTVAGTTNLARNRPAAASSVESAAYGPANAVDGNGGTRWASAHSAEPQWLRVDFGSRYTLSRVVLNWEAAYATAYQLQVSADGVAWTTVYSTNAGRGGVETIALSTPATGRYLRVLCTQRAYVYGRQWGYSLWEMQAFGTLATPEPPPPPPPGDTTNLALSRPAVASSVENSTYLAAKAVDGNARTRWASALSADPQWLRVDLGSRYTLSRIVLNWESAFAAAYQLQVSDDAATWRTVYSTTTGRGGIETITPATAATGRYVRLLCTQRTYVYGQQWGYSLWELQAFGAPATEPPPPPPPTGTVNFALGRPAVASSVETTSVPASNAVDGNTRTRWASAYSDPQWLRVDFGTRQTFSRVVLNWELAFAVAYQLQVSDDAATWRTVYSTSAGRGGIESVQLPAPATARYLRVYCTRRTYVYDRQWGYSLWELQAY